MNNSEDFQPPTGNPQNDVGGGLQPNSTLPQPVENNNQPGQPNPQALPKTDNLKVITSTNGTQPAPVAPAKSQVGAWVWLPAIIGVIIAVVIFKRDKKAPAAKKKPTSAKTEAKTTSNVLRDKVIGSAKPKAKKSKKRSKHKRR